MFRYLLLALLVNQSQSIMIFQQSATFFHNIKSSFEERRKHAVAQYRVNLKARFESTFDSFTQQQTQSSKRAQQEFDLYINRFKESYNETIVMLENQKQVLRDLERKHRFRPRQFDESLEQFRKFYDASSDHGKRQNNWLSWLPWFSDSSFQSQPFHEQIVKTTQLIKANWDSVADSASKTQRQTEESVNDALKEFASRQDDLRSKAQLLLSQSHDAIERAMSKEELLRERQELEDKFKLLERQGSAWVDTHFHQLETSLNSMRKNILETTAMYEELVVKRRTGVEISTGNDASLRQVLALMDTNAEKGWKLLKSEDGANVYRKFMSGFGSQYACVMCEGVICSPPINVVELLADDSRTSEYNSFYAEGRVVEKMSEDTKVVWCSSPPIFPFKARDFVTLVHVRTLKDGTSVVLNRALTHPAAPPRKEFVRASVVLAANIIQPIPGDPNKCRLTMLSQVDPGGIVPPALMNHLCTLGPIGFLKNVETASRKRAPRRRRS